MEIRPSVPKKKIFEGFLPYMEIGSHLGDGHVTQMPLLLAKQFQRRCLKLGTDEGRTLDHGYTASSPGGRWVLMRTK